MTSNNLAKVVSVATATLAVILVLLPFHALLSIWAANLGANYTLARLWKEILLLLLAPLTFYMLWKVPKLRYKLEIGWLFWAIIFYALLHILLGGLALLKHQVNLTALMDALILNLRFLLIFLIALVVATQSEWLKIHWRRLLLWPAAVVVVFGLLQLFVLPRDVLTHFGYSADTIKPFETVDNKLSFVRIQSTLRGANPLGAYLVLIAGALVVALLRRKLVLKKRLGGLLFLAGSLVLLWATYSRSAYIGTFVAMLALLGVVAHLSGRGTRMRRWLVIGLVAVCVVGMGAFAALRNNDQFQNTFFHSDEHSASLESSNASRASALKSGLNDILSEPFGRGPGTAGPASAHNDHPSRIAENYYLQLGQEVGWIGLILFVAINYMVVTRLWQRRSDPLARTLFMAFFGITLVNLLSHAWTDDTLSLLWWGFAGIALAPVILTVVNSKTDGTKTKTAQKEVAPTH